MEQVMSYWRCALVLLFAGIPASSQSDRGTLTGRAFDSSHVPVAAVKLRFERSGQKNLNVETDATGTYRVGLPAGSYTLYAESKSGDAKAGPIAVIPNKAITVDVLLQSQSRQAAQLQFFDEPQFTVAGVTDNTYRGGHGSDTVLRSSEELAKAASALAKQPLTSDAAEPHHAQAETDERSGRPVEAAREFQLAAELNPSERNLFDWGTELLSHRAPQAAAEVFTKSTQLHPQSVRILLGMATACYAEGSFQQSARWFFQAADLVPDDPAPYLFLGKVQAEEIKQSAGYRERMARYAQLRPNDALANYYYALSLATTDLLPERAHALLEKAIALDPHLTTAHLALGILYANEQKYQDAIRSYQTAIDQNPDLEEAHYRLSEAYRVTGNHAKAERELSIYHKLSKESAEKVELERREVQQFVIALKQTSKPQ
jgi:tetratricopeptide (TPR) repeat protein